MKKSVIGLALAIAIWFAPVPGNRVEAVSFHLFASVTDASSNLIGEWKVHSEVVWSDCPYVKEGSQAKSAIKIKNINGKLFPEWEAHGWQLVRNKNIDFANDTGFHWERESKLVNGKEYWFVRSTNDFNFDESGQLIGQSTHQQYLDGEYVGSYVTVSYLSKS